MEQVNAVRDDALGTLDAVGLVERLNAGEVSPVEVAEAARDRIAAVAPQLGALAIDDSERALRRLRNGPLASGFFAGVPTLLKENVDVAGLPTRHGTDAFAASAATSDGPVASLFTRLGTTVLGITRMPEHGFSASCEHPRLGPVRTPWDLARTAGASSSGSAALVAAGAVPFAHGNDGGGSIRIPASVNGLVGLKVTRGRVPSEKLSESLPVKIIADGVLTRSVRDTVAFLREAEKIHRPRGLAPIGDVVGGPGKRLRIAVCTEAVAGHAASPEVERLTLETAARLEELGHHVERVERIAPDWFVDAFLRYWAFLSGYVVATGPRQHRDSWHPEHFDNLTLGLAAKAKAEWFRIPEATARLALSRRWAARLFVDHDVVLTPTLAHETPLLGHLDPKAPYEQVMGRLMDWVAFTPLQNATGTPAVSLPLATTSTGLPQGMQFSAAWGRDDLLLQIGLQWEDAFGFRSLLS
ncbi:amidase [Nocardioides yefusunii]|uniref:Amidase n=1 Tax=Nocardioides yefusunii TaxID=2500546 RepID=A0ABW1QYY8_9ACTN|nr:amidase [Nocardioides yefusunii]